MLGNAAAKAKSRQFQHGVARTGVGTRAGLPLLAWCLGGGKLGRVGGEERRVAEVTFAAVAKRQVMKRWFMDSERPQWGILVHGRLGDTSNVGS